MEQEFFSPREIATAFGLSPHTIREWVRRGRIKHVKIGRLVRLKKEWVRQLFDQHVRE
jgi:excisionase family DNA binding protein